MLDRISLALRVNGQMHVCQPASHHTLLDVLRGELGLTGTKEGCRTGECGACTVLLDGRPVPACLVLAARAANRAVTTVEGLGTGSQLHSLQAAFIRHGALQCGYCTPGMLMTAAALTAAPRVAPLSEHEVRAALTGNLCRCTGYAKIVAAILDAAGGSLAGPSWQVSHGN
jgi:aerobic-type carbon monoxide dehydrogenase small subunit (CoxS/CutS family)